MSIEEKGVCDFENGISEDLKIPNFQTFIYLSYVGAPVSSRKCARLVKNDGSDSNEEVARNLSNIS